MKSDRSTPKSVRKPYPYLGYHEKRDFVVMFIEPNTGVVLYSGVEPLFPVGHYTTCWKENEFIRSVSTVTLSND